MTMAAGSCVQSAQTTPPGCVTLSATVTWALEGIGSIPLPIHNYLLISCFVCAIEAKTNDTDTTLGRKGDLC